MIPWYLDCWSDDQDVNCVTEGAVGGYTVWIHETKGWLMSQVTQNRMVRDVITLFRMAYNLKLNKLFISGIFHLRFSDYIQLTTTNWKWRKHILFLIFSYVLFNNFLLLFKYSYLHFPATIWIRGNYCTSLWDKCIHPWENFLNPDDWWIRYSWPPVHYNS